VELAAQDRRNLSAVQVGTYLCCSWTERIQSRGALGAGHAGAMENQVAQWLGLARLEAWSPRIETRGPRTSRVDLKIGSERRDDGLEAGSQPCPVAAWHVFCG
jgi:hypothetical protein